MKIGMENMAIEVTRRCNMMCAHCMRGDAQNMDIDEQIIENALHDVERIQQITFTGGEPTLNVPAIRRTLEICKENEIQVGSIYLVTNGKVITNDFLCVLIDWYAYCISCDNFEEDGFALALSQDMYHEGVLPENLAKLRALSFFMEEDKKLDYTRVALINEGRAVELGGAHLREINYGADFAIELLDDEEYIQVDVDSMIYISANGDVKTDCDLAYNNCTLNIGNLFEESLVFMILSRAKGNFDISL